MTMTKQDKICMISLFAVMLVLMGVPALCLSTNTAVDEMGTLANAAFRYKKRFFMTIIGIGGCMGLLLVGFGLRDSIMDVAILQYQDIQVKKRRANL